MKPRSHRPAGRQATRVLIGTVIRVTALLECLLLGGCVQSTVALESGGMVADAMLLGTWKTDLDGDPMVATIHEQANGELVAEVQAYWDPGSKASTKRFKLVLARFGDERYVSFGTPELGPNYSIARYVFQDGNRFCLHAAFSGQLVADVERQALPGEVKPDRHLQTVELRATGGQLRDYFAAQGATAFVDQPQMAFERVSAAELPPPRSGDDRDRPPDGFSAVTPCRR